MVATAAMSAFFPVGGPGSSTKTSLKLGGVGPESVDARGKSKPVGSLKVKANAVSPKINGTAIRYPTKDEDVATPQARTFINQLPDWSVLLTAITAMFLAAEKQWTLLDWKPRRDDMLMDPFGLGNGLGKIVQEGLVFRQNFPIRSYEIGADQTASIETMMNHLQESALNHVKVAGILGDGFGSTPEMSRRSLIWVVTKMNILVDRYPTWGDVVEVDTWVCRSGKNGMRRDWLIRDGNTGETLTRASSVWVMMNRKTRRLSKIPDEVREEIEPYFMDCPPIVVDDGRKLPKLEENTSDYIKGGLTPRWNDLDVNQHVNNVKYIGWILESAPHSILENHELSAITLEYRKECGRDSTLQSLTAVCGDIINASMGIEGTECEHLLRLESGPEIVRARSKWRPKRINNIGPEDMIPAGSL